MSWLVVFENNASRWIIFSPGVLLAVNSIRIPEFRTSKWFELGSVSSGRADENVHSSSVEEGFAAADDAGAGAGAGCADWPRSKSEDEGGVDICEL